MGSNNLFLAYDMVGTLCRLGVFRQLDRAFSEFIAREDNSSNKQLLAVLAALVSYTTTELQNVCLDLSKPVEILQNIDFQDEADRKIFGEVCRDIGQLLGEADVMALCRESKIVAVDPEVGRVAYPLVYAAGKLYLQRYWEAEHAVSVALRMYAAAEVESGFELGYNFNLVESYSRFLDPVKTYWQQVAVFAALRAKFSVITGGPGTGKTTVVAVIIALYLQANPECRVALAAPTGKAQARLKEAVSEELAYLTVATEIKNIIKELPFFTLHRLLGLGRNSTGSNTKLNYDLIVVDEASMISILLFQKFFAALKPNTKIILLGDMDQLAAVEGGAVLSDICNAAGGLQEFSADFIADFKRCMPEMSNGITVAAKPALLSDAVIPLEYTFRFSGDSGIGRMKDILCRGGAGELKEFIANAPCRYADSLAFHSFSSRYNRGVQRELLKFLHNWSVGSGEDVFLSFVTAASLAEAFQRFSKFQIITAFNSGVLGVEAVNNLLLSSLALSPAGGHGLPVMVTKNDYQNGLFNGDIGMYWEDSAGKLRVWFPDDSNNAESDIVGFRSFLPSQIPENIPAFAMTVHKAQGSGFRAVLLLLPTVQMSVLSKELLYTGTTRAKDKIDIFSEVENILKVSGKRVCRYSGLADSLS